MPSFTQNPKPPLAAPFVLFALLVEVFSLSTPGITDPLGSMGTLIVL